MTVASTLLRLDLLQQDDKTTCICINLQIIRPHVWQYKAPAAGAGAGAAAWRKGRVDMLDEEITGTRGGIDRLQSGLGD